MVYFNTYIHTYQRILAYDKIGIIGKYQNWKY